MYGLSARNISKSYNRTVLAGLSLTVSSDEKLALVGENGAGKTTLLRILAGSESADAGDLAYDEWVIRTYVGQEFPSRKLTTTVESYLSSSDQRTALKLLGELGFDNTILGTELRHLSGGQRRLIQLARAFALRSDFLFLDEPENHLDYRSREWLINKLRAYHGGLVFVSHDQFIIDRVANSILELEDGELQVFLGSYATYLEERLHRLESELRQWEQNDREIRRHKAMVDELRQRSKLSDKFSRTYHSKEKVLQRLRDDHTPKPQLQRRSITLAAGEVDRKGKKRIISLNNLSLQFGNQTVLRNVTLELAFGEKVCLFGPNGSGKTSLLRMIQGELAPSHGTARLGNDLEVGYFAQDMRDDLDLEATPVEELQRYLGLNAGKARARLSKFLFDGDSMDRKIGTLSGGQKTRLRFAKLFGRKLELLLLDEPTNHLDRSTWEVLADCVQSFGGTVLLISHDRMFIDQTIEKLWVIDDDSIIEFHGNLSEFLESSD